MPEILFTVSVVLTLAPYVSGALGHFNIPTLSEETREAMKFIGPALLFAILIGYYPFWRDPSSTLHSAGGRTPVHVVFENQSKEQINLDWLDENGKKDPKCHQLLEPGESQIVDTFAGHVWSFSNANTDEVLRSVIVRKNTGRVTYPSMPFIIIRSLLYLIVLTFLLLLIAFLRWLGLWPVRKSTA